MTLRFLKEAFLDHFHTFRPCFFWAFVGLYRRYNGAGGSLWIFLKRPSNWLFLLVATPVILSTILILPLSFGAQYEYVLYCLFALIMYGASGFALLIFTAEQSPEEIGKEFLN